MFLVGTQVVVNGIGGDQINIVRPLRGLEADVLVVM